MFTKLMIAAAVIVAGVLVLAATRPDSLRVQRTATIAAPPEKIFPHIDDLHAWGAWSPWEKKDPGMQRTYSGAASGKGAVYAWNGNGEVGKGRMEIVEAVPPSRVTIQLDFESPFEGHNVARFLLEPSGTATKVTWTMEGPTRFIGKLVGLFLNMDRMIGDDFESGLASLKALAEK